MSIEEIIFTHLPAHLDVPLYWKIAPDSASMPYIVYQVASDPNDKTMLSYYCGQARVQFDIYAVDAITTLSMRAAVKDGVRTIRGNYTGLHVVRAVVTNEVSTAPTDAFWQSAIVDVIFNYEQRG